METEFPLEHVISKSNYFLYFLSNTPRIHDRFVYIEVSRTTINSINSVFHSGALNQVSPRTILLV